MKKVGIYPKFTKYIKNYGLEKKFILEELEEDKIEESLDENVSQQYLKYAMSKKQTVDKIENIVKCLINNNNIRTIVDTTLGSGVILNRLVEKNNRKDMNFIGYEINDTRRMNLEKEGKFIIRKEFNKKELKKVDKMKTCLICDPPWGSWKIMRYKYSILGLGNFSTMGEIIESSNQIRNFIFVLPSNYYMDDLTYHTNIRIFKTGKSCLVVHAFI